MEVCERIAALRKLMRERSIDMYLVPTADFHGSEYVGDYFKSRVFLTGFTGSAGNAVVTQTEVGLWTDGRYFIQAAEQLKGSGVTLFRMGEEGVPDIDTYLAKNLPSGGCLGFDGRVVDSAWGKRLRAMADAKGATLAMEEDLVDLIWENRPPLSREPAFLLDERYAGKSAKEKLAQIRQIMEEKKADVHILTSLDDINWIFNLRGGDARRFLVVLSFAVITKTEAILFVQDGVLSEEILRKLQSDGVSVCGYEKIYDYAKRIPDSASVLLSEEKVNYRIVGAISEKVKIINENNLALFLKCVKNPVEIKNTIQAHIKDGVAFTKFNYWLKKNIGKIKMTEISAADYLEQMRRAQDGFLDLSFDTISAYGANAAMMHYKPLEDSCAELEPRGFLLVDSGGHYYEGSTDITRTIALGELSAQQKEHFTAVCRANIDLASARFLYGMSGRTLDVLSRNVLWQMGLDYKCGTGHGVGYILNIHEAPNGFRWKKVPERMDGAVMEAGMITTDEPGVYLEGEYGIRTENELLCCEGEKNEYGQFLYFQTITYAPIDLDAILPEKLTYLERKWLNDYHAVVYGTLSPYLTEEECDWLREATREI